MLKSHRRAFSAVLALILTVLGISNGLSPALATPDTVHLTVHYYRDAGDYTDWNVYLWKNVDGTGDKEVASAGFALDQTDDYGAFTVINVSGMASYKSLGFIIRRGAWKEKDGATCPVPTGNVGANTGDRFVGDSATPWDANGNRTIWLKQGDCTIYTTAPVVPKASPNILSASFDDLRVINVTLNRSADLSALTNGGFTLSGGLTVSSVVVTSGTTAAAKAVRITTNEDIPFGQAITVTQTGADAANSFGTKTVSVGDVMNSSGFNSQFTYTGNDLGATYSSASTSFRVWAPIASAVTLQTWNPSDLTNAGMTSTPMTADVNGTWVTTVNSLPAGTVYMYRVTRNGSSVSAIDPYAHAVTVNGDRGVVVDLAASNPTGWANDVRPAFSGKNVDAIIYELHVRDFSKDPSSGIPLADRGTYKAFTDNGTSYTWKTTVTNPKTKKKTTVTNTTATGIDAIKALGVTHVELLPVYDFASGGAETSPTFNWGYDPLNYNVPEGGYSTDPTNPVTRITELKAAIQNMHAQGLRVNMDVVYNHVADAGSFSMEMITPGYYFRRDNTGTLLNGTGCGNEVASERAMVRKFIVDSVDYWASEYHFDGFRFDLMGILDVTTMNQIRTTLNAIDPTIIILGEGWNMGGLADNQKADQVNIQSMPGIGAFNDQMRDGIKGSVFSATETGWASGNTNRLNDVLAGITGQTNFKPSLVSPNWTSLDPGQAVNYVESHDNLTLEDKIRFSYSTNQTEISQMDRFMASIMYLAQGMPFQQAGQEFERSKGGDDNSYMSGDAVNSLKYKQRVTYATTLKYYTGLIALRKAHPAFRMSTTQQLKDNLRFTSTTATYIGYTLNGNAVGDTWSSIYVGHNAAGKAKTVTLPGKFTWYMVVNDAAAGTSTLKTLKNAVSVSVPARSTVVLYHQ